MDLAIGVALHVILILLQSVLLINIYNKHSLNYVYTLHMATNQALAVTAVSSYFVAEMMLSPSTSFYDCSYFTLLHILWAI